MSTVVGTVISIGIDVPVKKQGGGTYQGWELVYKSRDGEVRTIAKPVTGLRFNQALASSLKTLSAGDVFTLTQEKNAQGFNDVQAIEKGDTTGGFAPPAQKAPNGAQVGGTAGRAPSTYETPEERQIKQRLIVRQWAGTNALEVLKSTPKANINLTTVTELADQLVDWVYETGQQGGFEDHDVTLDIPD